MSSSVSRNSALLLGFGGLLLVGGAGLLTGYIVGIQDASATEATPEGALPADDADLGKVRAATQAFLETPLTVRLGERSAELKWSDVGATIDEGSVSLARLDDAGKLAGTVPVAVDSAKVQKVLAGLDDQLGRSPRDAWLDLENRKVRKEEPGLAIDVYGSAEAIEAAARAGKSEATLVGVEVPAAVTVADLGIDDISTVLSTFSTKYRVSDTPRNANLKLLASRIDGTVLQPGKVFSFNETSGARTEKEGYKTAHVILKGEMVDGMAGGSCQISTTLHGAAFFAGLEVVSSTPHSRPSTYVTLGLDATVVYPTTDLKLRNNYDFPVVIHYKVARGVSEVEILGKKKPFDKIKFERVVKEKIPFETITREDDTIGVGNMVVDQKGEYGFKVKRYRKIYKDGHVIKKDAWNLEYHPVIEYVRMGTNPDPNLPPPKPRHH